MMKKMIAFILAVVLCVGMLSMLAGCGNSGGQRRKLGEKGNILNEGAVIDGTGLRFDETFTIDVWEPDNTDLELEGSYCDTAIEKTVNVNLNIVEYESRDQYETLIAQEKIPALTFANAILFGPAYGPKGAYIDWTDYIDMMPNVKKHLQSEEFAEDLLRFTETDGSIYQLPVPQSGYADVTGFLYRKDIFEKHNLTFPTNQDELYETLKELKKLYPNSYPFVVRSLSGANMGGLTMLADLFGGGDYVGITASRLYNFNNETEEFYLAQTSQAMKECLEWLNKLYREGLLHPSCVTMDSAQWIEAFASNKSFIGYDKMDRIEMLTMGAIDANKDYVLTGAAPFPLGSNGDGTHGVSGNQYSWLVSGNLSPEELEKVLRFVDWLYSEEGIRITNWGIEGESYIANEDGTIKDFKEGFVYEGSGLGVNGLLGYRDFDAYCLSQEQHVIDAINECAKYCVEKHKNFRLDYTDEEQEIYDMNFQRIYDRCQAWFQKFIVNEKNPTSDWNAYVDEINAMIPSEMMDIHLSALERYKEAHPDFAQFLEEN